MSMFLLFGLVLYRRCCSFIGPAWDILVQPAKVCGKQSMSDFVRQHAIQNPLSRPLDAHHPIARHTSGQCKTRLTTSTQIGRVLNVNGASLGPGWQFTTKPVDRQVSPLLFSYFRHLPSPIG
jgi:hypothetical protein